MIPDEDVEAKNYACDIAANVHIGCAHMNVRSYMTVGHAPSQGHTSAPAIPAEAVETAARGIFALEQCDRRQKLDLEANWMGRLDERDRDEYRYLARAALEAAAPHMVAGFKRQRAADMDRADEHIYPNAKQAKEPTT